MTRSPLRCGVYLPPMGPLGDPRALVDLAVRAERAGWDGVFLWDHVVSEFAPVADTWTTLGAIAVATETILLGPMVTPLPRRRPWVVARQAATVQALAGGRLIVGFGLGADETGDFSRFGEATDLHERRHLFEEGLDIVRAMWSGAEYHHEGASFDVDVEASTAVSHPIPVWTASSNASTGVLARAATCDGTFFLPQGGQASPDDVARVVRGVAEAGRPPDRPFEIAVAGNASGAWPEPKDVDLAALAEAGATWWMESLMYFDPLELSLAVVDAPPPW